MLRSVTRFSRGLAGINSSSPCRRAFTYAAKHTIFPATLYRTDMQFERISELYDLSMQIDGWADREGVEISKDGLVHPNICQRVSNGAQLTPNIHLMHEMTGNAVDYYIYALENGHPPAADPHFVCIPKGTVIPKHLTLFHEKAWQFSLQPTYPMSIDGERIELNKAIARFYYTSGRIYPLKLEGEDFMSTPWGPAVWQAKCEDEDEEGWMKQ
ncbi:hypothetical protein N7457_004618 [Penicillium paradoxum]|uniref:uncharacterized protein n=1 Tax=Penicillium paradoxum TaxID=176176 RepID=UPI002546C110|nr:uncharacterized protein N7457_004618 [Penicillium paradoxum]KAJ5782844.1 hypothetical protein N7457_004618 [Penicillium paradoxum]